MTSVLGCRNDSGDVKKNNTANLFVCDLETKQFEVRGVSVSTFSSLQWFLQAIVFSALVLIIDTAVRIIYFTYTVLKQKQFHNGKKAV